MFGPGTAARADRSRRLLIVSEALTNAAKHASASEIPVCVEPVTGGADFSRGTGLVGLKTG